MKRCLPLVLVCLVVCSTVNAQDVNGPPRSRYAQGVLERAGAQTGQSSGSNELIVDEMQLPSKLDGRLDLSGTWTEQAEPEEVPGTVRFTGRVEGREYDVYTILVVVAGERIELEGSFDGETLFTRRRREPKGSNSKPRAGAVQTLDRLFGEQRSASEGKPLDEGREPQETPEGRYRATFSAKATTFETETGVDLGGATPIESFKRYNETDVVVPSEWAQCEEILWSSPNGGNAWGVKKIYRGAISSPSGATHRIFCPSMADRDQLDFYLAGEVDDLSSVVYVVQPIQTVWIRDYGPIVAVKKLDSSPLVADMGYFRRREVDDAVPQGYARFRRWGYRDVSELKLEGGNYMTDGQGKVFLTNRATESRSSGANGGQESVEDLLFEMGAQEVVWFERMPQPEGTGHIDMFAKLVGTNSVLVGETTGGAGAILERNAAKFTALGYTVTRLRMGDSASLRETDGRDLQTYTNSLFINGTALVPQYGDAATDAAALKTYQSLGFKAVGIDVRDTIVANGAIHCISMQIPKVN